MNRTLCLLVLLLAGCSQSPDSGHYTGYVEVRQLLISAPQSGWLTEQPVQEGRQVQPGQTLFALESEREQLEIQRSQDALMQKQALLQDMQKGARQQVLDRIRAQLAEAQARLELANLEVTRQKQTAEQQLSSQASLDQAIANQKVASAQLKQLEEQLAEAGLAARPDALDAARADAQAAAQAEAISRWNLQQRKVLAGQSGWVDEVFYRPGEFVNAGVPVLSLRLANQSKVRFYVPVAVLSQLALGQSIQVGIDGQSQDLKATVSFLAKQAEFTPPVLYGKDSRDKLMFLVEADLPADTSIPAGLPVDVTL
ncbi:HlyD family efflux transporter periplasmic adaptor subunit [Bowmanella denitrificans]|uniref:HlyD family efflux transporter periplasmic adaptor subunit n=1 Tax=Bowmanella denitrificans TaxID=366582 RepID=A0ABP3GEW4_9ALTE